MPSHLVVVHSAVVDHESVVIILAVGDAALDGTSLAELPDATVRWQRVEREGDVACVAARMRHALPPEEFGTRIRGWGRSRGWLVTVAPCGRVG
jgi:hypothetical protein